MRPFSAIAIFLAALSATPTTSALAQVTFTGRSVAARINTTKADFSDAVLTLDATTFVQATAPGTRSLNFMPLPGFSNGTFSTSGGVVLTNYMVDPFGGSGQVVATGNGSFTFHNSYTTGVDDPYAFATLIRYTSGATALPPFDDPSLPLIEVFLALGAAGLVDQGGTFLFSLTIPGDYSSTSGLASRSNQHFEDPYATVLSGFSVQQDYVYDPVTNTTTLSLFDGNIDVANDFIALDTYFVGSAVSGVPEPTGWATMIVGFGMIGLLLRRRRRSGASAQLEPQLGCLCSA